MVNNQTTFKQFTSDGSANLVLQDLEYLSDENNLKITRLDTTLSGDQAERTLTLTTNYTVDTSTDEITIISDPDLGSAPFAHDVTYTVTTDLEFTQTTDITSNSNYDPEVLEKGYDKSVLLAKQNKESIDRTVKLSQSDVNTDLELPPLAVANDGYLFIQSDGGDPPTYTLDTHPGPVPKIYDPLYPYTTGMITQHNGDMWICRTDDTGTEPGTDISVWEVYNQPKNAWNAMVHYSAGNIASYGSELWLAVNPIDGIAPKVGADTNNPEWTIYANRYDSWDSGVPYPQNAITSYGDATYPGTLVRSKVDDNLGNIPNLAPGATDNFWEVVKTGGSLEVEGVVATSTLKGVAMYFDTDGKLKTADNRELSKSFVAGLLVEATTGTDETQAVRSGGLITLSGLIQGTDYYLGNTGDLITRGSIDYSEYIVYIGRAVSNTQLDIKIRNPEPTRNQDDGNPVGSIKYFSTYKDRSAYGYLPFAFDNAISQANYSALWNEIGHIYNEQHVAAGDTDLSGSSTMFYPTPIPGAYDRVGVSVETIVSAVNETTTDTITIESNHYTQLSQLKSDTGNGLPIKIKLISGILTGGLSEDTLYYVRFRGLDQISFYLSESDAIQAVNPVTLTDTNKGTFRLTQEGIVLNDAFQTHDHSLHVGSGSDTTSPGSPEIQFKTTHATTYQNGTISLTEHGSNGTPRTTNETRPKTNYSFGYIKAENVTSAGEPISALRDEQPWVEYTGNWRNKEFIVTPAPSIGYSNVDDVYGLQIEIWLADDATPTNPVLVKNMQRVYEQSTTIDVIFGLSIMPNDNTSFKLQTGEHGVMYMDDSGGNIDLYDSSTGAYKVIITKPNLINTVFDISTMPKTYDLTTGDITVTLPEISGVMQTKSIYWTNGGTYKLSLVVTDSATIGGLTASTWEGEGEGHIVLESDGQNWQVREYEDYWTTADGKIWKNLDGTMKQLLYITTGASPTYSGSGGSNYYATTTLGVIKINIGSTKVICSNNEAQIAARGSWIINSNCTSTTLTVYWGSPNNTVTTALSATCEIDARWRT